MIKEIGRETIGRLFKYLDGVNHYSRNDYEIVPINAQTKYVKYTSIKTMYKMLDSDSVLFFCSELSNDKTENQLLPQLSSVDTYITCFYHNNGKSLNVHNSSDVFSQWMSYCKDGGAAFEFYFGQDKVNYIYSISDINTIQNKIEKLLKCSRMFDYSLICSEAKDQSDFIKYSTFPFQVQYYTEKDIEEKARTYVDVLMKLKDKFKLSEEYIAPYLKHSGFVQECEARLAFVNYNNQLSKCISFMTKSDGTKLPYINVKFGDLDDWDKPCNSVDADAQKTLLEKIDEKISSIPKYKLGEHFPIVIPQGRDQEEIYNLVENRVIEMEKKLNTRINIICQGHLPITKITLAPTEDRREQKKKMKIYCKSKYWLRHVQICESKIPYNTHNNNHL